MNHIPWEQAQTQVKRISHHRGLRSSLVRNHAPTVTAKSANETS